MSTLYRVLANQVARLYSISHYSYRSGCHNCLANTRSKQRFNMTFETFPHTSDCVKTKAAILKMVERDSQ
jgi:hypothetical protein